MIFPLAASSSTRRHFDFAISLLADIISFAFDDID
jgi:hypothetical protein